jgi:hypothetical protein
MEQFIGCDAHKKFSLFIAMNHEGEYGRAIRVGHEREQMRRFLAGLPAGSQIALETSGSYYWLGRGSCPAADVHVGLLGIRWGGRPERLRSHRITLVQHDAREAGVVRRVVDAEDQKVFTRVQCIQMQMKMLTRRIGDAIV